MSSSSSNRATPAKQAAGAFDVRNVIAALIGFYGVVLVLMGLFSTSADDRAKTGDFNANLWVGIAMLVFAAVFALWSRLRPVVVDPGADVAGDEDRPPGH
jgi:drug/metabolite transporter (DMT)-like permease